MTSNLLLAHSYLALGALAPASAAGFAVHPAHAAGMRPPVKRGAPARTTLALAPITSRVRADRADGRLTLTFA
jgi:hypothetical protein